MDTFLKYDYLNKIGAANTQFLTTAMIHFFKCWVSECENWSVQQIIQIDSALNQLIYWKYLMDERMLYLLIGHCFHELPWMSQRKLKQMSRFSVNTMTTIFLWSHKSQTTWNIEHDSYWPILWSFIVFFWSLKALVCIHCNDMKT